MGLKFLGTRSFKNNGNPSKYVSIKIVSTFLTHDEEQFVSNFWVS